MQRSRVRSASYWRRPGPPFAKNEVTSKYSAVRYIDSGSRDPAAALGSWLRQVLDDSTISALRWQTGFFTAEVLGYFVRLLNRLRDEGGFVNLLVGSNDGTTQKADVEALLRAAGPPRDDLRIGVVSYSTGYFHPKTIHLARRDGSAVAYVGSANVTGSGITALHVEAGLVIDSREGDDTAVLSEIARAVDLWFEENREGLHVVRCLEDVESLVHSAVLNVPRPVIRRAPVPRKSGAARKSAQLRRLITPPALPDDLRELLLAVGAPAVEPETAEATATAVLEAESEVYAPSVAEWRKRLPASDAQRKSSGNQSGAIALTKAGYNIDAQTYFRDEFFASAQWLQEATRTGQDREAATVPMRIRVLGTDLGTRPMRVTYASNRESGQNNYTSLLHLGPLSDRFRAEDMTDKWLTLRRFGDGTFTLSVSESS